jgi:hypothetical protein
VKLKATKKKLSFRSEPQVWLSKYCWGVLSKASNLKKISGGAEKDDTHFLENLSISCITYDGMTDAAMIN